MRHVFLVIFLFLNGVGLGAAGPAGDPWPMEPGWAVRIELSEGSDSFYMLRYCDGETYEIAGHETTVVYRDVFGVRLGQHADFYSRNREGDLFLHGSLDLFSGEVEIYDPPLLYLDMPLEVGKSWEVDCRLHDDFDLEGEGERQHLIMKVAAWDTVETPAGTFHAWKTECEVVEGNGMGTDWFAPDAGPVRGSAGQGGPLWDVVDLSAEGIGALEGMGEPVKLTFGWQPGVPVTVSKYGSRIRVSSTGRDTIGAHFDYTLEFNRLPTGYLVHMADLDFGFPPAEESGRDLGVQEMVARLSRAMPDFLISKEGAFMGLAGAEASLEATFEVMAETLAELDTGKEESAEILANMREIMTVDVYAALASEEWNKLVGTWVGAEGETGLLFEGTLTLPVPMLPGQEIPLDFQFAVAESCPCRESGTEDDCVRLIFTSRTDVEAAREALADFMQRLGGEELAEIDFNSLDVATTIQTVMEPGTMRLHRVFYEKIVNVEVTGPDGRTEPGEQIETEWYYFTYPE